MTDMKRNFGIAEEKKEIKPVSGSPPEDVIIVGVHYNHENSDNADSKIRTLILNDILRED